jgi:phosphoglycolate phosphatase
MKYRIVVFDFDGTLADTFPWFARTINGVADKYGFRRVRPEEVEEFRGLGGRELLHRLEVPLWKVPLIAVHLQKLMTEEANSFRLFPGTDHLLERLAAHGVNVAILTSNTEANVRLVMGDGLVELVGQLDCRATLFGKGARLRHLLKRAKIAPESALFVGDELRDAEAAAGEQVDFAGVAWGFARREVLAMAANRGICDSWADLARIVGLPEAEPVEKTLLPVSV